MKRTVFTLMICLLTLSLVQAQRTAPNPDLRAMTEPYTNLVSSVGLMLELEKTGDLPITTEQAALLLPILSELSTSSGYDAKRATQLLDRIELEILTPEQLIWMDSRFLELQKTAQTGDGSSLFGLGRPEGQGEPGQGGSGQAGDRQADRQGGGQAGARGEQGSQGEFFQRITAGELVNMFVENEAAVVTLDELIQLVSLKAE